jgi:hypothetical protein
MKVMFDIYFGFVMYITLKMFAFAHAVCDEGDLKILNMTLVLIQSVMYLYYFCT